MKKILLGMLVMAFTFGAGAQKGQQGDHMKGRGGKMEKKGMMKHKMAEKLNLSDAQKEKMKTVNENFRKQMQDLKGKENITVKDQRDQRYALAKKHKENIQAILTPDQKKQVEEMKTKHEVKRKEKMDKRLDKMGEKFSLTSDQKTKIKSMNEGFHSKMKALKANESLSREQKKTQMESLKKDHKAKMETVFTKEQKAKMEEMKKSKGDRKHKGMKHDN